MKTKNTRFKMGPQIVTLAALALASQVHADESAWIKLGGAAFGRDEKSAYGSVLAGKSLSPHLRLQIGATGSGFRNFDGDEFTIRHGGTEVEALATYAFEEEHVELSLGVSAPHTEARKNAMASWKLMAFAPEDEGLKLYGDAYGVAGKDSISMVGGGALYRFSSGMMLDLSGAVCIMGNNTVNTSTGNNGRGGVYNVGLLFPIGEKSQLGVSLTNQLGWTTGMSATPSLGGRPGVGASLMVKF